MTVVLEHRKGRPGFLSDPSRFGHDVDRFTQLGDLTSRPVIHKRIEFDIAAIHNPLDLMSLGSS